MGIKFTKHQLEAIGFLDSLIEQRQEAADCIRQERQWLKTIAVESGAPRFILKNAARKMMRDKAIQNFDYENLPRVNRRSFEQYIENMNDTIEYREHYLYNSNMPCGTDDHYSEVTEEYRMKRDLFKDCLEFLD